MNAIFSRMIKITFMASLAVGMSACSGDDEIIFKTGSAGPNTKNLLKTLPDGLVPDTENVNHTDDDMKPAED